MSGALHDTDRGVSPTTSPLDPSQIDGAEWRPADHNYTAIRYVRAPLSGGPHTLKYKTGSGWNDVPVPGGSDGTASYVHTATLEDGQVLGPLQIVAIVKAGSSAGSFEVAP